MHITQCTVARARALCPGRQIGRRTEAKKLHRPEKAARGKCPVTCSLGDNDDRQPESRKRARHDLSNSHQTVVSPLCARNVDCGKRRYSIELKSITIFYLLFPVPVHALRRPFISFRFEFVLRACAEQLIATAAALGSSLRTSERTDPRMEICLSRNVRRDGEKGKKTLKQMKWICSTETGGRRARRERR